MTSYTGQTFNGQRIVADNNTYESCIFKNCVIVHQGGKPPSLSNCQFDGSAFSFDGPAANTLIFFRALCGDPGMRPVVADMLPELFARR